MSYIVKKDDTFKVKIQVDVSKKHPKALFEPDPTIPEDKIKEEWAEFYRISHGISNKIRSESLVLNNLSGIKSVDLVKFNDNRLRYLLKDWSLVDDEEKKIELKRTGTTTNEIGRLDDKSWVLVNSIEPNVILAFLAKAIDVWDLGEEEEKN